MSKPRSQAVTPPVGTNQQDDHNENQPQAPLSGSKKVKQQNHSRHNNGEG